MPASVCASMQPTAARQMGPCPFGCSDTHERIVRHPGGWVNVPHVPLSRIEPIRCQMFRTRRVLETGNALPGASQCR